MQIGGKMSQPLADSDKADFLEIWGFHVPRSVNFFRGFSLLSHPSVLQNLLWSAQFTEAAADRQTDKRKM